MVVVEIRIKTFMLKQKQILGCFYDTYFGSVVYKQVRVFLHPYLGTWSCTREPAYTVIAYG